MARVRIHPRPEGRGFLRGEMVKNMTTAEEIVEEAFERKKREMEALKGLVEAGVYGDMEEAIREAEIAKARRARRI